VREIPGIFNHADDPELTARFWCAAADRIFLSEKLSCECLKSEAPKANSNTGMEGDASIGTPATPGKDGNASCKIRRVPANAMAIPIAPPAKESSRLSQ